MKKEINITAQEVINEDYTRQEAHAIASAMLDKLFNTPETKKEIYIETKDAKPFCIIETDEAILLPFIGKKIVFDLYKEACKAGHIGWGAAKAWCEARNAELFPIRELVVVRYFVDEIDNILEKRGLVKFSSLLENYAWSSQADYLGSWVCSSSSVNLDHKRYGSSVVPACKM